MTAPAAITAQLVDVRNVEEWRSVARCPTRYEVSSLGRVRSIERYNTVVRYGSSYTAKLPSKILKPGAVTSGHLQVCVDGAYERVHCLVAEAFIGPRPLFQVVRHKNGVKTDNRAENLCYGTVQDNADDSIAHGTQVRGERCGRAKLTEADVRAIRASTLPQRKIGAIYGVAGNTIKEIRLRRIWQHVE